MSDDTDHTFLGLPGADIDAGFDADIAVFGAPHGTPYEPGKLSHSAAAPQAIRAASMRDAPRREHYDFDWSGVLGDECSGRICDLGDVPGAPETADANRANIESWTRKILGIGATPVLFGGDDSVPIPFVSAFSDLGPLWVVQIDAHLDWRDERDGERLGWSSPMRRMSEMEHVEGIVQVGLRGLGTARRTEVDAANEWGAKLFTARNIHEQGVGQAVAEIPESARVLITLDFDGMDPSLMPGVLTPVPGGLTYTQVIDLIHGLARRASIAGIDLVELMPERDPSGLSSLTAYRVALNAIAAIGQKDRK